MYFPWTVCDYPLAQAVEDRIVKAPLIVTKEDDPKQPMQDPDHITRENVCEKYGYWIHAAVQRWQEHSQTYRQLGTQTGAVHHGGKEHATPMPSAHTCGRHRNLASKNPRCSSSTPTQRVRSPRRTSTRPARRHAISTSRGTRIKAIVSVMMLREGWDVRNVSVVLGLRPFTAKAEILPEQVIGRGLRLMTGDRPRSHPDAGGARHAQPAERPA